MTNIQELSSRLKLSYIRDNAERFKEKFEKK